MITSTGPKISSRAIVDALLDVAADPVALGAGDHWSQPGAVGEGITDDVLPGFLAGELLDFGQAAARDDHPGQRAAGLARVQVARRDARGDRGGEVGVVEQHVGGLPAQLEGDALDALRGDRGYPL